MDYTLLTKTASPTISFMPPKTIVLVGLMGCGKTSIGKRLAKRLELPFNDSDHAVEDAAGCPIKDIYSIYGEEAFLSGEQRVIARLLEQPTHILATGGTSFANEPTRELIKNSAISVWLNADLETLVARVSRRNDRPLLANGNQREVLEQMIEERYPLYQQADIHVQTLDEPTNITVDRVIQAMTDYIREKYPSYYVLKSVL
ncbi:MAG: shikimate kinase [Candidatus Paracaedibacteraceae bacterium]|nr:shikimate kinase [Candidatus Paracaedibacteraceae bacterium]